MDSEAAYSDLLRTLQRISRRLGASASPARLAEAAAQLESFVVRHRAVLSFEHFPLPAGEGEVMSTYELYRNQDTGPTLLLNAIRSGADSAVHDHGTWAVIVAIEGQELNRVYRQASEVGAGDRIELGQADEIVVRRGQPLVLEAGDFHSIHTGAPTLLLHLYGRPLDAEGTRRIVDPQTGALTLVDTSGG